MTLKNRLKRLEQRIPQPVEFEIILPGDLFPDLGTPYAVIIDNGGEPRPLSQEDYATIEARQGDDVIEIIVPKTT